MALKQLVEKRNELQAKQQKLKNIFQEGRGPDGKNKEIDLDLVKSLSGTNQDKLNEIRKLNEELDALQKEIEKLVEIDDTAEKIQQDHGVKNIERFTVDDEHKGFGDLFVNSDVYKSWKRGKPISSELKSGMIPILKATFSTTAGWPPESIRIGKVVEEALRPIQVIDTIPGGRTGQAAVVYVEETTVTNAAAERDENAVYPESALELTQQTSTVRSIGTSIPVTDEQLEDVEEVRSYFNMRLPFLVRQRLDGQLLVGNGTAPNILGLNNVSGINTQAKGADPVPDAIYKGMDLIRITGRASPNIAYMHPNDWQPIVLLKTADGVYIWGHPSQKDVRTIWGIPVVVTDAQTENTGLIYDTIHTMLFMRKNVIIEIGYNNADFTYGRVTFRVGCRATLVVFRPAAGCQITGL